MDPDATLTALRAMLGGDHSGYEISEDRTTITCPNRAPHNLVDLLEMHGCRTSGMLTDEQVRELLDRLWRCTE